VFPWSTVPTDTSISCAQANVNLVLDGGAHQSCVGRPNDVGAESPAGDGLFLQSDLAGNVFEWTLDSFAGYVTPCNNCANLGATASRVTRGGGFDQIQSLAVASYRNSNGATNRAGDVGFRCARVP
jgi:formylglycine-generating enzyme required for sulfatase activity